MSTSYAKEPAARTSLDFIEDEMVVGLGTGSTASCFINLLGERMKGGLKIRGIPTSKSSKELAESLAIPVVDLHQWSEIDVEIDGADEIGPGLVLIKGGGGALLHEKIVASASKRFIVIADSSKVVSRLEKVPLPVEVIPAASPVVARKLAQLGIRATIRRLGTGSEFITDEGNLILDCECGEIRDPDALATSIRNIVGVVEHGLFLHMTERALVSDGSDVKALFK
jgi:ribose 5-phosphate isomerase A